MILKYLEERRKKKRFIVVHVHAVKASWNNGEDETVIIASLSENGYGERKIDVRYGGRNTEPYYHQKLEAHLRAQPFYYEKIIPWLSGREIKEIDTYSQAKEGDCVEALKR